MIATSKYILKSKVLLQYNSIAKSAISLINKVEHQYHFESGINRILVIPYWQTGAYFEQSCWVIGKSIQVPDLPPRSIKFKEVVLHELGHAIHDQFQIKPYLNSFINKNQSTQGAYRREIKKILNYKRMPGFASSYARLNREEDYCETFAAYLLNNKSWRKQIHYDDITIKTNKEVRLLKKLEMVHQLLRDIKHFK